MRTLIILLLFAVNLNAQWVQQNSGVTTVLRGISTRGLASTSEAWVVGLQGTILHTTNGGTNWIQVFSPTNQHLYDVHFINQSTGLAAGFDGVVIRTTNAGSTWTVDFMGMDVYDIHFINTTTGYLSGETGAMYKTTNAGLNWNGIPVTGMDNNATYWLNTTTGFVAGQIVFNSNSAIKRTTNSSSNWSEVFGTGLDGQMHSIIFFDDTKGWACGTGGTVVRTTSGGFVWTPTALGTNIRLNDIYFSEPEEFGNGTTGWMAADSGKMFITTNGGVNWAVQTTPTTEFLFAVKITANTTGWAVGSNGTILKTTNGGTTIGIQQISAEVPTGFIMKQNYPNPFNPVTNINFDVPKASHIKLVVFDINGKEMTTLVNQQLSAGMYNADWDAGAFPSGVYFYRIETGDFTQTKKMVLVK